MNNPWCKIAIDDYEKHMSLNSVKQLQTMNIIMKEQFAVRPIGSVIIFGIASGNGLEHINPKIFKKVYGLDVNQEYLEKCIKRYPNLNGIFKPLCIDLNSAFDKLPYADLLVANLFIEYVGYNHFQSAVKIVNPKYVSCVIQINEDETFVSDSPYTHVFDQLDEVLQTIEDDGLIKIMTEIDYKVESRFEYELPNGKKFVRIDFRRKFV